MTLGERLRHTRDAFGMTLQQVAERIGLSAPTVSAYETDGREPSFSHLAKIAKLYCRPVEYFFSEKEEVPEVVVWRTKPFSPAAEGLEAKLLELGGQYQKLEIWFDSTKPARLPQYDSAWSNVSVMAASVRKFFGLGDRPGAGLEEILQEAGVKIFHLEFEPRQASASTVTALFGPAVLLNGKADKRERTYSLAHELFHLLTWGKFPKGDTQGESLADQFADHLLLPDEALRQVVVSSLREGKLSLRELDLIATGFNTPLESLLRRLGDVLALPKGFSREILLRAQGAGFSGQPDWTQTVVSRPRRFVELATKAYENGKLSLGKLAEYLGISRQEAVKQFFHDGDENIVNEEVQLTPS